MTTTTKVANTPNGREIRLREDGLYEVQPHNDNYWLQSRTIAGCMYLYHYPDGIPSARQFAELIIDSWDSQWSIDETARIGVSEVDCQSALEVGGEDLAAAIITEIEQICLDRASIATR